MTNDALKAWLPENLGDLTRTGYKVGKTEYLNVASIEGTFKNEDGRELQLEIMDGAGEIGSVLMTSMSMAHKMDVEEDENKHLQTLTRDGIKVKQTYFKKGNLLLLCASPVQENRPFSTYYLPCILIIRENCS